MAISDIPILSMLRTRMQWNQARQQVLAENVANADTPNYQAKDLAPPDFRRELTTASLALARRAPARPMSVPSAAAPNSPGIRPAATRYARAATR